MKQIIKLQKIHILKKHLNNNLPQSRNNNKITFFASKVMINEISD